MERVEHVKIPVDPESGLEETVVEILTTKRDFYDLQLLEDKKVPPKRGFFVEGDVIYVDSELFKELLEEMGIKERKEKIAKAIQRLLVGPAKKLTTSAGRRYFWRFNLKTIQAILRREGEEWTPEIKTESDEAELSEILSGGVGA